MNNKKIYVLGEILLRLETNAQKSENITKFKSYFGGAAFNVAICASGLGNDLEMISIVPNNFIGDHIEIISNSFNVGTEHLERANGNQGIYFLQNQGLYTSPRVTYNRTGSVFEKNIKIIENIEFGKKGNWLHLTGISLSLDQNVFNTVLKIVKNAFSKGIKISFDFNYRSKLINYKKAKERYEKILPFVSLAFATKRDFTKILGHSDNDSEKEVFQNIFKKYKELNHISFTTRSVENNVKKYQGHIMDRKANVASSKLRELKIVDRVGGGDAFAAAILNGVVNKKPLKETVEEGICSAIIAQETHGDYSYISKNDLEEKINKIDSEIIR